MVMKLVGALLSACLAYAGFLMLRHSFIETEKFSFNPNEVFAFAATGTIALSVGLVGIFIMLMLPTT